MSTTRAGPPRRPSSGIGEKSSEPDHSKAGVTHTLIPDCASVPLVSLCYRAARVSLDKAPIHATIALSLGHKSQDGAAAGRRRRGRGLHAVSGGCTAVHELCTGPVEPCTDAPAVRTAVHTDLARGGTDSRTPAWPATGRRTPASPLARVAGRHCGACPLPRLALDRPRTRRYHADVRLYSSQLIFPLASGKGMA